MKNLYGLLCSEGFPIGLLHGNGRCLAFLQDFPLVWNWIQFLHLSFLNNIPNLVSTYVPWTRASSENKPFWHVPLPGGLPWSKQSALIVTFAHHSNDLLFHAFFVWKDCFWDSFNKFFGLGGFSFPVRFQVVVQLFYSCFSFFTFQINSYFKLYSTRVRWHFINGECLNFLIQTRPPVTQNGRRRNIRSSKLFHFTVVAHLNDFTRYITRRSDLINECFFCKRLGKHCRLRLEKECFHGTGHG